MLHIRDTVGISIQELYLSKVLARFVRYFAAECLPKRALCVPLIARGRRFRPHSDPVSRGIPLEAGLAWRIGAQKKVGDLRGIEGQSDA